MTEELQQITEEERQLLADWLAIAESAFTFWDNDLDAAYDNL